MYDDPLKPPQQNGLQFAQNNFSEQKIRLADADTIIAERCLISREALIADEYLMLDIPREANRGEEMVARWTSLITIPPQDGEFAFRGMQVRETGLVGLLREGMKNTRQFHTMLAFGIDAGTAVPYSFKPASTDIAADENAISVLCQVDIPRLRDAGIRVDHEQTYGVVYDIWSDIPASLLDRVFIYDHISKEFLLLSESTNLD